LHGSREFLSFLLVFGGSVADLGVGAWSAAAAPFCLFAGSWGESKRRTKANTAQSRSRSDEARLLRLGQQAGSLNNNKTFCSRASLFSSANYFISNNFYLYLISIYIITKHNSPSILTIFFRVVLPAVGLSSWSSFWAHVYPKTELTIPKCLDWGPEHSCPVQKPPDSSQAWLGEEAYQHLTADTTFSPVGRWGAVAEAFLIRHLTTLNLGHTRGVASTVEKSYRFVFHLFEYNIPPLEPPLSPYCSISLCLQNFLFNTSFLLLCHHPPPSHQADHRHPRYPLISINENHLFISDLLCEKLIPILSRIFHIPKLYHSLILRNFLMFLLTPLHTLRRANQVIPFSTDDHHSARWLCCMDFECALFCY